MMILPWRVYAALPLVPLWAVRLYQAGPGPGTTYHFLTEYFELRPLKQWDFPNGYLLPRRLRHGR